MTALLVVDLDGQSNAPLAVTLDALDVASELAGRTVARVACVGGTRGRSRGVRVPWSALGDAWDGVIVPGLGLSHARDPGTALASPSGRRLVAGLRAQHERGALVAASCTGTFALAEAGLLEGRVATTSWWLAAEFRRRHPDVVLREGALTTQDGNVLCAGGSLAHVDLMLVLIARLFGAELATRVAQYLVSPWRGPQSAVAEIGQTRITDTLVARASAFVQDNVARDVSVADVARAVAASPRTLHRRTRAALGVSVVGLVRRIRGEAAMKLLRETDLPLTRIAERVGYQDVATLATLVTKLSGQTPAAMRRHVQGRH